VKRKTHVGGGQKGQRGSRRHHFRKGKSKLVTIIPVDKRRENKLVKLAGRSLNKKYPGISRRYVEKSIIVGLPEQGKKSNSTECGEKRGSPNSEKRGCA